MVISMLLFASPKAQLDLVGATFAAVEQVGDVKTYVQSIAAIGDFEFFLGFFLLGVSADDVQLSAR